MSNVDECTSNEHLITSDEWWRRTKSDPERILAWLKVRALASAPLAACHVARCEKGEVPGEIVLIDLRYRTNITASALPLCASHFSAIPLRTK